MESTQQTKIVGHVLNQEIKTTQNDKKYLFLKFYSKEDKKDFFINLYVDDIKTDLKNKVIECEAFSSDYTFYTATKGYKLSKEKIRRNAIINHQFNNLEVEDCYQKTNWSDKNKMDTFITCWDSNNYKYNFKIETVKNFDKFQDQLLNKSITISNVTVRKNPTTKKTSYTIKNGSHISNVKPIE